MALSLVAVRRAHVFSPGHESDDWLVLKDTADLLASEGHRVSFLAEEQLGVEPPQADVVLNMCQGPDANRRLQAAEGDGTLLINRPSAALGCLRRCLLPTLHAAGIPIPESLELPTSSTIPDECRSWPGVWIKRADVHATTPADVVRVACDREAQQALGAFRDRGLERAIVQEHLPGAVVKFYAVGTSFFHHKIASGELDVEFDCALLRRRARQCADALGLDVFGGECIVNAGGTLPVIDVNDWPSFAPCRIEAAQAIARLVIERARPAA